MKYLVLLLSLLAISAQAGFSMLKNGLLIDQSTNKPYTGVLEIYNKDWDNRQVEFAQDYVNGVKHGNEKGYYQSGRLKSVGKFIEGEIEGTTEIYYEDGTLRARVDIKNSLNEGRAVSYHLNGYKASEQFYFRGKLQGLARTWYEGGTLKTSVYYSNGMKNGEFTSYHEIGSIFEEIKYDHDMPKFKRVYAEDGSLIDETGFFDKKVIDQILG